MATKKAPKSDQPVKFDASMRVVILRGADQYMTSAYTRKLVEALTDHHGEIEQFSFDGETVEPANVLDELRSYGLMQQHKLVIVDNADRFLAVKDEDETRPSSGGKSQKTARELMERYVAGPADSATLLLRAPTWRPGRLDKAVAKIGGLVAKCEAPSEGKAISWCVGRCQKEYGCEITRQGASMLVERIGPKLARLDVEMGKLAAYVGPGGSIGPDAIREMVGLSREEQAWEIQSAILTGSPGAAITKLRELVDVSGQPDQLLSWAMTDLVRKLHAASQLVRQGVSPGEIARELRLWGDGRTAVLNAARRAEPDRFAQLLRQCIQADLNNKSGLGKAQRTLEALAVRIADTMGCT